MLPSMLLISMPHVCMSSVQPYYMYPPASQFHLPTTPLYGYPASYHVQQGIQTATPVSQHAIQQQQQQQYVVGMMSPYQAAQLQVSGGWDVLHVCTRSDAMR